MKNNMRKTTYEEGTKNMSIKQKDLKLSKKKHELAQFKIYQYGCCLLKQNNAPKKKFFFQFFFFNKQTCSFKVVVTDQTMSTK